MKIFRRGRYLLPILFFVWVLAVVGFQTTCYSKLRLNAKSNVIGKRERSLNMNVVEDAFRFFSNLNKEASAKHILVRGPNATEKLLKIKEEIESAADLSLAFSDIASKVKSST
jgi:hypothetical protein